MTYRMHAHSPGMSRVVSVVVAVLAAAALFFVSALPAWAAESITVTFVRHGESEGNASGKIDTSIPGPHLTPLGVQQAQAVADALAANGIPYDAIFASDMVRTQETAAPLAGKLGLPIVVLPGLHEINAGIFEGSSEDSGLGRIGYVLGPVAWMLGARFVPIPGSTDSNGNVFEARMNDAIQTIYDGPASNPVVFSHGATIMFWTLMNVDNPDPLLLLSHQLDNTSIVVIEGNPEDGWTLVSWDGVEVAQNPSLPIKLFVDVRDLIVAPQTALYNIGQALATGNIAALATAITAGVVNVATTTLGFVPAVLNDIVGSAGDLLPATTSQPEPISPEPVDTTASRMSAVAQTELQPTETPKAAADPTANGAVLGALTTDSPKSSLTLDRTETANGATDLSAGNAHEPGKTAEPVGESDSRLGTGLEDVHDLGENALNKSGDVVKPVAGKVGGTDGSEASADTGSVSSHQNAA